MPLASPQEKRRVLAEVPLFQGLEARALDALVEVARSMDLRARQELFHKGDDGAHVYVVVTGRLKVLTTSNTGDDVVFSVIEPGEVIGEIALLAGSHRTATVAAIEVVELLVIDRRDFLAVVRNHPDVSLRLLKVLAERLRNTSEMVEDTLFLNLPLRLAKKLAAFAESYGERNDDGVRINLKLSQEEWGDLVGATRESINKQMRGWTQDGLISTEGGYITVRQMEALLKLAREVVI